MKLSRGFDVTCHKLKRLVLYENANIIYVYFVNFEKWVRE
jgi:hypothetical protein